jgi:hypothetical protein
MSNRLEQEFPSTSWRAAAPIGTRGLDPDLVRRGLDRGRRLRNQAIRNSLHSGIAAVVGRVPGRGVGVGRPGAP